jgi:hypothetical protein
LALVNFALFQRIGGHTAAIPNHHHSVANEPDPRCRRLLRTDPMRVDHCIMFDQL